MLSQIRKTTYPNAVVENAMSKIWSMGMRSKRSRKMKLNAKEIVSASRVERKNRMGGVISWVGSTGSKVGV